MFSLQKQVSGYLPGDLHAHTVLSDGSHTLDEVLEASFRKFGLKWIVITDHGGAFSRNEDGILFSEANPGVLRGEEYGKKGYMWRSQSIIELGNPEIERLKRQYPKTLILHGLEFNTPCKGHAGVLIITDVPEALAKFEYIYDYLDNDKSLSWNKINQSPDDALKAVKYLEENYPEESFFIINHPHVYKAFTPRMIRLLNDTAPRVVNGFEGIPGHQYRNTRGCYYYEKGEDYRLYRTYGGADCMLAKVGGLWDSLLGEGRRFFVFAGSDFHTSGSDLDPFPGEYNRTYLYFNNLDSKELVKSVKNGKAFIVSSNLIEDLEFNICSGSEVAGLGEDLSFNSQEVLLNLRIKLGADTLDHIDIIEGEVRGKFQPESPEYDSEENQSTSVILRIFKTELENLGDGFYGFSRKIKVRFTKGYLRLRGTNLPLNTPFETDCDGNPLIDDHETKTNTKEIALNDTWFYTNPIFYNNVNEVVK